VKKARIVVAEDEPIIAMDLKDRLEKAGHQVMCTVRTGEDAIRKAIELQPDMMLMDIGLEGNIDGIAAMKKIRERDSIPVVFLTAFTDVLTPEMARTTGASGLIVKPLVPGELESTIDRLIARTPTGRKTLPC
jgi:DNA-binding response OmpR family regulator